MVWLHSINKAVEYIEENICEDITAGEVAAHVHSSYSNFVRIFSRKNKCKEILYGKRTNH